MELRGFVTTKPWGKYGAKSSAAKLYWNTQKRNKIHQDIPYSEFWITPDPEALCTVLEDGEVFGKFLERNPEVLGKSEKIFNRKLPFVIKVLSIDKVHPLKFHPSKDDAELLHEKLPSLLVDSDHLPKFILSLGIFELLCGLRPIEEIQAVLLGVPELSIIIPFEKQNDYISRPLKIHLKDILLYWLTASEEQMKLSLDMYFERMEKEDLDIQLEYSLGLMKRLQEQQPNNPGVFAPLFLNRLILTRSEVAFISTGVPYCFIAGDGLELSSRSNNEILLGLTGGDSADLEVVQGLALLSLESCQPDDLLLSPEQLNENIARFRPPVREFALDKVEVRRGEICSLTVHDSCSILLVTRGIAESFLRPTLSGKRQLVMGSVVFLLPYQKFTFTALKDTLLYHVYPNTDYFP